MPFQIEVSCSACGVLLTPTNYSTDHIWPKSRGGTNNPENLWDMCRTCNSSKGQRTMREWLRIPGCRAFAYWRDRLDQVPLGEYDLELLREPSRRIYQVVWRPFIVPRQIVRLENGDRGVTERQRYDEVINVNLMEGRRSGSRVVRPEEIVRAEVYEESKEFPQFDLKISPPFRHGDLVEIGSTGRSGTVLFVAPDNRVHVNARSSRLGRLVVDAVNLKRIIIESKRRRARVAMGAYKKVFTTPAD